MVANGVHAIPCLVREARDPNRWPGVHRRGIPVAQDVVVLVHFHQVSLFRDEIPRVALEGTDAMDLGALRQAEDFQFKPPIVRLVGVAEFDSLEDLIWLQVPPLHGQPLFEVLPLHFLSDGGQT